MRRKGEGKAFKELRAFQQLWEANAFLQAESQYESPYLIACGELVNESGLDKLRKEIGSHQAAAATNALCRTYEGIVTCFNNVPSPFGEQNSSEETAISTRMILKEQGDVFWDFYQSLGGEVIPR